MGVLLLETCFVCSVNTQPPIMPVMQCLQFTTNRPKVFTSSASTTKGRLAFWQFSQRQCNVVARP